MIAAGTKAAPSIPAAARPPLRRPIVLPLSMLVLGGVACSGGDGSERERSLGGAG
ncbi:MAG: hypothetical protein ACE5KX_02555 [Acidimicrobiia bacterium]